MIRKPYCLTSQEIPKNMVDATCGWASGLTGNTARMVGSLAKPKRDAWLLPEKQPKYR